MGDEGEDEEVFEPEYGLPGEEMEDFKRPWRTRIQIEDDSDAEEEAEQ